MFDNTVADSVFSAEGSSCSNYCLLLRSTVPQNSVQFTFVDSILLITAYPTTSEKKCMRKTIHLRTRSNSMSVQFLR
jgi:hypothetical protein